MSHFHDHFSTLARHYADYRPAYPAALFEWLAGECAAHDLAWDCGAGSGQASVQLARYFRRVVATDGSQEQIAHAAQHPRVEYRRKRAEEDSGIDSNRADLVAVAQALHWFDRDAFHAQARGVLKPGGLLAAWCYETVQLKGKDVNALVQQFYRETLDPYWPPQRIHVQNGYRDLAFPFRQILTPAFTMTETWTLEKLLGYLRSWSATGKFIDKNHRDPVADLERPLQAAWGDARRARTAQWQIAMLAGRKD